MESRRNEFGGRESYKNEKRKASHTRPSEEFEYPDRLSATEKYKWVLICRFCNAIVVQYAMNFIVRLEWRDLSSLSEDAHLKQLRHLALNGGLKVSKFRSVCWSLLLGVLTGRSQSWVTQRRCDRNRYFQFYGVSKWEKLLITFNLVATKGTRSW